MRIGGNFALIHNAILVVMEEFDRVLDRQNVIVTVDIDLINHRGERGRFTGTCRTGHKYQAARLFAHVRDDRREPERVKCLDLVGNCAENRSDRSLLVKKICTES